MANSGDNDLCETWWGGWLQAAKEKSTAALEMVRKDLAEFGCTMQQETGQVVHKTTSTLKDSLKAEHASTTKEKLSKGLNSLLEGISKAMVVPPDDEGEVAITKNSSMLFDRAEARLHAIQVDPETYLHPPHASSDLYNTWCETFDLESKKGEISELLVSKVEVRAIYTKLVPSDVSHVDFWRHYFYKLHQIDLEQARKEALMKRADQKQEDSISWEDDWSGDEDSDDSESEMLVISNHRLTSPDATQTVTDTATTPIPHTAAPQHTTTLETIAKSESEAPSVQQKKDPPPGAEFVGVCVEESNMAGEMSFAKCNDVASETETVNSEIVPSEMSVKSETVASEKETVKPESVTSEKETANSEIVPFEMSVKSETVASEKETVKPESVASEISAKPKTVLSENKNTAFGESQHLERDETSVPVEDSSEKIPPQESPEDHSESHRTSSSVENKETLSTHESQSTYSGSDCPVSDPVPSSLPSVQTSHQSALAGGIPKSDSAISKELDSPSVAPASVLKEAETEDPAVTSEARCVSKAGDNADVARPADHGDEADQSSDLKPSTSNTAEAKAPADTLDEDWDEDIDVDVTEEDLKAAEELAKTLGQTVDLEEDDWENWE